MRESIAWYGVRYIAACEWALGFFVSFYVFIIPIGAFFSRIPNTWRSLCVALITMLVLAGFAGICFFAGRALICAVRWGWFASLVIGVVVMALSLYLIHVAMLPDPYGDSGEAGLIGMAMVAFALPALGLLLLPSIRRHVGLKRGVEAAG